LEGTLTITPGASIPDTTPTLSAEFRIMQYAASGLKVDHLSLMNERYKPYKGVKFITKAGKFNIRS
jgi:AP-3 complex subunit mu